MGRPGRDFDSLSRPGMGHRTEGKREKIQLLKKNEVVILSWDRGLCPGIFAPVFVPGQRDKVTRFVLSWDKGTMGHPFPVCPSLSQDVSGLSGPEQNPSKKVHTLVR